MGELKSAWEIAQEKANKLGQLSPTEIRQQLEQRCQQTGVAIAERYLDHGEERRLLRELSQCPEEEQDLIRRAVVAHLAQALSLDSFSPAQDARVARILQGIAAVRPEVQPTTSQIGLLMAEYQQAWERTRQEIEDKARERLHQLRISGTAVGDINLEAMPEWQETWGRLAGPFEQRLNSLKQELIQKPLR